MKKILTLSMMLFLSACSSTGPVPMGKDTYMISRQSAGGIFVSPSSIKAELLIEANAYCNKQNRIFQIVNSGEQGAIPGARLPSAEIQFMCLIEGDREIGRPKMQRQADTTIEIKK